jgi:hypothetical protein
MTSDRARTSDHIASIGDVLIGPNAQVVAVDPTIHKSYFPEEPARTDSLADHQPRQRDRFIIRL